MRIISQNGAISVDFDNVHVLLDGSVIFCRGVGQLSDARSIMLGRYFSESRAQEVFVDIHRFYEIYLRATETIEIEKEYIYYMPET